MTVATLTMTPAVDLSTATDSLSANRKLRCKQPRCEPGGGGINIAIAMHELQSEATALFPCGGPPADTLKQALQNRGVRFIAVPIEGHTRSNVTVTEQSSNDQYRFVMPGPELTDQEIDDCLNAVRDLDPPPTYLVASGSLPPGVPPEFMGNLAALAEDMGSRLLVDTSGEALRKAAARGVYLLKPNMRELRDLSHTDVSTEEEQEKALQKLIREGACDVAVLSLGAAGVLVVTARMCERMRTPTVPIVSRVGAGDSMMAGILVGLSREYTIRNAVRLGLAAGSAAVMTPGTELCRREDVERLYKGDDQ